MNLPLYGRRIVVTRAREQAQALITRLEALGALAIALPTIAFAPPADFAPLDRALGAVAEFSGFIFTSANGVRGFFERARQLGLHPRRPEGSWVCAIGPATAGALADEEGWAANLTPERYVAEGVVAALASLPLEGRKILLPRAAAGRDLIPIALAGLGATVTTVETHRTVLATESEAAARAEIPGADAVVFTSPSTARNLATLLGSDYRERLQGAALAAIGPVTRQALEGLGLRVDVEAPAATMADLAQALAEYWHA